MTDNERERMIQTDELWLRRIAYEGAQNAVRLAVWSSRYRALRPEDGPPLKRIEAAVAIPDAVSQPIKFQPRPPAKRRVG